jgi:hypothetical protein
VNEVVEFPGFVDEEDRGVLSRQIPVYHLGVELDGTFPRTTNETLLSFATTELQPD